MPEIVATFDGVSFRVLPQSRQTVIENFDVGERVVVTLEKQRSAAAHRRFFAMTKDYWTNVPESLAAAPFAQTVDAFRKHALIAAGYHEVKTFVAKSRAEAERVAGFITAVADDYGLTTIDGYTVQRFTAKSMSYQAMSRPEFKEYAPKALDWMAETVGARIEESAA